MRTRYWLTSCALLGALGLLASAPAPAGEKKEQGGFADYQKLAAPGPEHQLLAKMAGTWEAKVKTWMDPTKKEPDESTGTFKRKMILGGRYLQEEYKGNMAGKPFEGGGLVGYDKVRKQYTNVWVDSMSTGIMTFTGQYDPKTKTYTYTADDIDGVTGKKMKFKSVARIVSDDEEHFEMYVVAGPGMEFKVMEIHSTRKK